jgi:hypothetical protein
VSNTPFAQFLWLSFFQPIQVSGLWREVMKVMKMCVCARACAHVLGGGESSGSGCNEGEQFIMKEKLICLLSSCKEDIV